MSNKVIGIFLSVCLIAPMLGMYGWLHQRRKAVRKEVKHQIIAGLDRSELVLLSFTTSELKELKWEHSKEFAFEGEMYDIVETEVIDGVTYYWCWSDDEETALNKQLFELTNIALGLDPLQQNNQNNFKHYCKTLFFESPIAWAFPASSLVLDNTDDNSVVISLSISPPVPPPEA